MVAIGADRALAAAVLLGVRHVLGEALAAAARVELQKAPGGATL